MTSAVTAVLVAVLVGLAALVGVDVPLGYLLRPTAGRPPRVLTPGDHGDAAGDATAEPALVLDLTAAALAAGAPPQTAMTVVGQAVGGPLGQALGDVAARLALGSSEALAWAAAPAELAPLRRTLDLASTTGAPAAALLQDAAGDLRRRRHREAEAEAARLGVRMVLPLGLCALPAFVLWAVVPVVLSLATRMLAG